MQVDTDMHRISRALAASLRFMDGEASTRFVQSGHSWPTGLRQYHWHRRAARPDLPEKLGCEESWSQRLGELLRDGGLDARAEGPGVNYYPPYAIPPQGTRRQCDLQVSLRGHLDFWLEVKGAWPVNFNVGKDGHVRAHINSRYRTYFLDETMRDLRKLERLRQPDASTVGLLLVSFDHERASLAALLPRAAEALRGWTLQLHDGWREPHYGTDIGVRLYLQQVDPRCMGCVGGSP